MDSLQALRVLTLTLFAGLGLALAACGQLSAHSAPTDRFVIMLADDGEAVSKSDVATSINVIEKRLAGLGLTVHRLTPGREARIVLEVSGENALRQVEAAIGIKGDLSFRLVDTEALIENLEDGIAPPGSEVMQMSDGLGPIAVKRIGGISGDRLVAARAAFDGATDQPTINISFDAKGAEKFARLTTANVGQPFAIVLDGRVLSTPIITEPIVGGQAQIAGNFTQESANQLAVALASGALPTRAVIAEHMRLDPDEG